jgi:hypothetical protein
VPQAGSADFLLLTQNWRGTAEIDTILSRSRYVYGDAKAGGTFSGGGLIATLSAIDIGPPEGKPSALANKAAGLFASADLKTNLHVDMGFMAVRECLEVVRRRGVVLSQYPEAAPFLTNSALRRRIYRWVMTWMLRHDEYTKRCSAHAFGDPMEVKTFYQDLLATGHDFGVSMPAMESYAEAVRQFAVTPHKNAWTNTR